MKEFKVCPNCSNPVGQDAQHCHICQAKLREPRLNLPGKIIVFMVYATIILAAGYFMYFSHDVYTAINKEESVIIPIIKALACPIFAYLTIKFLEVFEGFAQLK